MIVKSKIFKEHCLYFIISIYHIQIQILIQEFIPFLIIYFYHISKKVDLRMFSYILITKYDFCLFFYVFINYNIKFLRYLRK